MRKTLAINVLEGEDYVSIAPDLDGSIASRALPGLRVDAAQLFSGIG